MIKLWCRFGILCAVLIAGQAMAGSVSGKVEDKSGKPLRDAVIFIESGFGNRKFPAPTGKAKMDTSTYAFKPHVLAVQAGTTVEFTNGDWELHNFYSTSSAQPFDLKTISHRQVVPVTFSKPGVVHVQCHFHEEMSAYIVVSPTPYFVVTNAKGRFAIPNVPSGKYKIKLWHEGFQVISRAVTVGAGQVILDFKGLTPKAPSRVANPAFKPLN